MSSCLYLSERALRENSSFLMVLFSLSLCSAMLTHYSSLIFAFTMGVYMLVRLSPYGKRIRLVMVWGAGQIGALALASYYLITHVAELKRRGMAQGIAETWLRKSIFHAGENHVLVFIAAQTLRVFTYLLSHGIGGTLALLAFLVGIFSLLKAKRTSGEESPVAARARALARPSLRGELRRSLGRTLSLWRDAAQRISRALCFERSGNRLVCADACTRMDQAAHCCDVSRCFQLLSCAPATDQAKKSPPRFDGAGNELPAAVGPSRLYRSCRP